MRNRVIAPNGTQCPIPILNTEIAFLIPADETPTESSHSHRYSVLKHHCTPRTNERKARSGISMVENGEMSMHLVVFLDVSHLYRVHCWNPDCG